MSIVGALPFTLQNGTTADATQVMADFNSIKTDVNTNGAANGANNDITSLAGLTTPLSAAQGGTGLAVFPYSPSNAQCQYSALVVAYASVATVTIAASFVVLTTTSNAPKVFSPLSETLNIASSGVNGLDTGAEASSTWYHIWAIGKADGTLDGLLSVSATAPTMPAGYTYKGYLGAVYNNSGSDFDSFYQRGSKVAGGGVTVALSGGSATTFTAISLAVQIPTTATIVSVGAIVFSSSATTQITAFFASDGATTTDTYKDELEVDRTAGATSAGNPASAAFDVVLSTAQQIKYYGSGTNPRVSVVVRGWQY